MSRLAVVGLFGAAAASSAVMTVQLFGDAAADGALASWATAVHAALKLGVLGAFTYFVAVRADSREASRDPVALLSCIAAVVAIAAVEEPAAGASTSWILVGDGIAVTGGVWLLVAVLALGRCFGILPEVRGLVTRGPYRLVRHPVYLGELAVCGGLVVAAPTVRNLIVAGVFAVAQAVRMRLEETALTRAFPEYERYAALTPRLVPRPGRHSVFAASNAASAESS